MKLREEDPFTLEEEEIYYEYVVNKAPEKATHFVVLQYDLIELYIIIDEDSNIHTQDAATKEWCYCENFELNGVLYLHCLEDFRKIIKIRNILGEFDSYVQEDDDYCNSPFREKVLSLLGE